MKTLTKPEKFRIASPSIYGYCEGEWTLTGTSEDECEIIYYYDCIDAADVWDCCPGDSYEETVPKSDH